MTKLLTSLGVGVLVVLLLWGGYRLGSATPRLVVGTPPQCSDTSDCDRQFASGEKAALLGEFWLQPTGWGQIALQKVQLRFEGAYVGDLHRVRLALKSGNENVFFTSQPVELEIEGYYPSVVNFQLPAVPLPSAAPVTLQVLAEVGEVSCCNQANLYFQHAGDIAATDWFGRPVPVIWAGSQKVRYSQFTLGKRPQLPPQTYRSTQPCLQLTYDPNLFDKLEFSDTSTDILGAGFGLSGAGGTFNFALSKIPAAELQLGEQLTIDGVTFAAADFGKWAAGRGYFGRVGAQNVVLTHTDGAVDAWQKILPGLKFAGCQQAS